MLFKAVSRMKAGLGAAYSVFLLVLTTVAVITLLYFFVNSISSPTVLEWLAVIGIVIVIYVAGIAASLAGLHAIEKLFKRDKNRAIRRQGK
jgi:uncharacterized membrane protein